MKLLSRYFLYNTSNNNNLHLLNDSTIWDMSLFWSSSYRDLSDLLIDTENVL